MHIPVYYHKVSCSGPSTNVLYSTKLYLRSTATISVVANGILLLLLNLRTSRALGNYRFLIGSFALADILISLFHAWYIPIFILGDYGFVWFGHGTFLKRSSSFFLDSNIVYAATFYFPFCLLGLHFIYRFFSLARRSRGVPQRFRHFIAPYGIESWNEELNVASVTIVKDAWQLDTPVLLALIAAMLLIGHTLLISLVCIVKISIAFNKLIDIRARRFHMHLFRALLIQFTIPVLTSLIPLSAIFLLPMTGANLGELGNVFGLLASVYPALDPILIIVSISRHVLVIAVSMLFPSRFSFRTTLQRWVHVLLGSTASINERKALERSRRQTALLHSISMNML
ncbi:hypothetical protein PRIPAC_77565 [Pristionchus pacificus]|uniref:G protein-coupled receptor n=1 Tax=Pristionchus pacificus TaxID=54126 RepID=A0A2A6CMG5_PRIPA|nr:hypothetical protein PRIPAC_77565 [Pristionchus pacificus]|eukprot:PDM79394.1 G protein-coupled receptor [Pristionchus pacificus]